MENLNIFGSALFIGYVIVWRCGPSRSELWRIIKDWAEDNEEAAVVRETRRALRRQIKPRPTVAHMDNGAEWSVEKGGSA